MEDFVTWVDSSAIKKHIMEYNEMVLIIIIVLKHFLKFINTFFYFREMILIWLDLFDEMQFVCKYILFSNLPNIAHFLPFLDKIIQSLKNIHILHTFPLRLMGFP